MKKIFMYMVITSFFALFNSSVKAQIVARPTPLWVSSKGYWVVENNIHSKKSGVIRYFNNEHVLVLMEYVQNRKLNLKDREVKIKLKEDLEAALKQWQITQLAGYMKETISASLH